ncbi:hypothetical protein [Geodermatophilus amargosae]|uniref:hypothetical protein n=1 Tax=Geodermatophilus amargosae TaxID=1296565 RepID=UPI000B81E336|nr:hypothetical protein [Geodermatophilus amargosae]
MLAERTLERHQLPLLTEASHTADAADWLASVADDPEVSTSERRLCHAEAARQRTLLARLLDQLAPLDAPVPPPAQGGKLAQLRAIHGDRPRGGWPA